MRLLLLVCVPELNAAIVSTHCEQVKRGAVVDAEQFRTRRLKGALETAHTKVQAVDLWTRTDCNDVC